MRFFLLAIGVLLAWPSSAEPHRLDEYLQATRLAFTRDGVVVELDLTPGVSVAPQIFAMVDGDGDTRVSPAEIETYGRRVLHDLSLQIDGEQYPLTLRSAESPSWDEIREGVGTFRLEAFTNAPLAKRGRHHIVYENSHEATSGVYLVNALLPSSNEVILGASRRDGLQRRMDLDVEVTTSFASANWVILSAAATAIVLWARRLRPNSGS